MSPAKTGQRLGTGAGLGRLRRRWEEAGRKAERELRPTPPGRGSRDEPEEFVHPRVAERLAVVASERARRRRRRALVGLAVATVAVLGTLGVAHSSLLGLRVLRVEGATGREASAVVRASGISDGEPLIDISAGAVEARVDRLPDVRSVALERRWPHTVVLVVKRHRPVALLALGSGGFEEVDGAGRAIRTAKAKPAGLVLLEGVGAVPVGRALPGTSARRAVQIAGALAKSFPPALEQRVGPEVKVQPGSGSVELLVDGKVRVRLGGEADLGEKMRALAVVLERVPLSGVAGIDLVDPELPALTPSPTGA